MDNELVTGSESHAATGGGNRRRPVVSRYGEKFEELCGYYMSIGMTYHDYWDGDAMMAKYFREADELSRERENYNAWLHGVYIYEALLDASPALNALSKKKKPYPYRKSPIPITKTETIRKKDEENREKLNNGLNVFRDMIAGINKKFEKKEG